MKHKGLNDNKITVEAGISNGLIGKGRKRGSLSQDSISKILYTYTDLNADWLLTGRGDMLRHQPPDIAGSSEAKQMSDEHDTKILLRGIDRLTAHIEKQDAQIKELTEINRMLTEKLNTSTDSGKSSKAPRPGLGSARKEQ